MGSPSELELPALPPGREFWVFIPNPAPPSRVQTATADDGSSYQIRKRHRMTLGVLVLLELDEAAA